MTSAARAGDPTFPGGASGSVFLRLAWSGVPMRQPVGQSGWTAPPGQQLLGRRHRQGLAPSHNRPSTSSRNICPPPAGPG
eukprot:7422303-Alexandrium_andersonii.AAC.1